VLGGGKETETIKLPKPGARRKPSRPDGETNARPRALDDIRHGMTPTTEVIGAVATTSERACGRGSAPTSASPSAPRSGRDLERPFKRVVHAVSSSDHDTGATDLEQARAGQAGRATSAQARRGVSTSNRQGSHRRQGPKQLLAELRRDVLTTAVFGVEVHRAKAVAKAMPHRSRRPDLVGKNSREMRETTQGKAGEIATALNKELSRQRAS